MVDAAAPVVLEDPGAVELDPTRRFVVVGVALIAVAAVALSVVAGDGDEATSATTVASAGSGVAEPVIEGFEVRIAGGPVAPGAVVTAEPLRPVERICTDLAGVHGIDPPYPLLGLLSTDGRWSPQRDGVPMTVPGCDPPPSSAPTQYVVPDELGDGTYLLCFSTQPSRTGCGPLIIAGP